VPQRYASGNLAIKTVVEDIRVNPVFDSSDLKVLMPVAQSNKGRRHWTLLALERPLVSFSLRFKRIFKFIL
jgi:hypothetical protein